VESGRHVPRPGLIDLAWERQRFTRNLRMSKQEIKEETKEVEGNLE